MSDENIDYFAGLTAEQINNERLGKWGDYELLSVWQHFVKERDRERETAVLELILHSPEHSEMVDYGELYYDLAQNYHLEKEYTKALGWLYAAIAYDEQHEPSSHGRIYWRNSLAEIYIYAHEFNTGLTIFAQNLHARPDKLDTYNIAAYILADIGLSDLTLELLERAFAVAAIVEDEEYNSQWEDLRTETESEAQKEENVLSEVDADVLSSFRAALTLPIPTDLDEDAPLPLLPPIDQLATADSLTPTLTNEVLAQSKVLVPELIRLAFSDPDTPGPTLAITLLRQLRDEDTAVFAELSPWLDRADNNWQDNLSQSIGKIGGFTTAELKDIAADPTYDTFVRTSATEALRERRDQNSELHDEIVLFFRQILNRSAAHDLATEEEFIGFLISDVLDADLRELYPDIKRAFVEDRVDPSVVGLREVEEEWELPFTEPPRQIPRKDGLNLLLRCSVCDRKRFHFSRHVLVDTITLEKQQEGEPIEFDAHILDHEIICPKCGSADQYRLTHQAHIALLGQQSPETLLAMFSGQKPDKIERNPRVHYKGAHALGGPMHPLKAVQRYQQLIAAQPNKADLYVRLGGIFLFIMRFDQGLAHLRQGYQLDPDDIEAVMRLAMAEHDFGDRQQAKELYQRVFQLARQDIFSTEMMEIAATARDGLKALERGEYSPMDIPISASVYYGEPEKRKSTDFRRISKKKKPKKRRR
jgi:tetratricopeptide (TPR) repeat protein